MAERLKTKFLEEEQLVDLVVGPDAYRDLPNLLKKPKTEEMPSTLFFQRRNLCRHQSGSFRRKWRYSFL
jgi:tRNA A37 methylthiotransferase MiaB